MNFGDTQKLTEDCSATSLPKKTFPLTISKLLLNVQMETMLGRFSNTFSDREKQWLELSNLACVTQDRAGFPAKAPKLGLMWSSEEDATTS